MNRTLCVGQAGMIQIPSSVEAAKISSALVAHGRPKSQKLSYSRIAYQSLGILKILPQDTKGSSLYGIGQQPRLQPSAE